MAKAAVSLEDFVRIFNDINTFPSVRDIANKLGVNVQSVKNRAHVLRTRWRAGDDVPELIVRGNLNHTVENPLSNDESRFEESWTAEDCIAELRRIAEASPEKIITRNGFRNESSISESTWNRYFGTFQEFKRQAGIILSRGQHKLEREIAIHASRDVYRRIGDERHSLDSKYLRPTDGKYKTILVGSDLHDIECDPFWKRVFIETAARIRPDVICLNGDVFDLAEFGKYNVDPREWDIVGRIRYVHDEILAPLREACPDTQIDIIEGNHEARLLRQVAEQTPAMRAILADLHGFTVGKLLGLERFQVNYVAKADLAAVRKSDHLKELAKNYRNYFDCFIAHHFPQGRHMGMPGWNGHHHSHEIWENFNPIYGTYEWHQVGAGHRRDAEYCAGERWGNGFLIASCNTATKSTIMDYVQITDFCNVAGNFYYRDETEGSGSLAVWPGK